MPRVRCPFEVSCATKLFLELRIFVLGKDHLGISPRCVML